MNIIKQQIQRGRTRLFVIITLFFIASCGGDSGGDGPTTDPIINNPSNVPADAGPFYTYVENSNLYAVDIDDNAKSYTIKNGVISSEKWIYLGSNYNPTTGSGTNLNFTSRLYIDNGQFYKVDLQKGGQLKTAAISSTNFADVCENNNYPDSVSEASWTWKDFSPGGSGQFIVVSKPGVDGVCSRKVEDDDWYFVSLDMDASTPAIKLGSWKFQAMRDFTIQNTPLLGYFDGANIVSIDGTTIVKETGFPIGSDVTISNNHLIFSGTPASVNGLVLGFFHWENTSPSTIQNDIFNLGNVNNYVSNEYCDVDYCYIAVEDPNVISNTDGSITVKLTIYRYASDGSAALEIVTGPHDINGHIVKDDHFIKYQNAFYFISQSYDVNLDSNYTLFQLNLASKTLSPVHTSIGGYSTIAIAGNVLKYFDLVLDVATSTFVGVTKYINIDDLSEISFPTTMVPLSWESFSAYNGIHPITSRNVLIHAEPDPLAPLGTPFKGVTISAENTDTALTSTLFTLDSPIVELKLSYMYGYWGMFYALDDQDTPHCYLFNINNKTINEIPYSINNCAI